MRKIGGGVGGLTTGLNLHAESIEYEVFDRSRSIRELGVRINILTQVEAAVEPNSVAENVRRRTVTFIRINLPIDQNRQVNSISTPTGCS